MGGRGGAPRTNLNTAIAQAAARAQAANSPEAQIRQTYFDLARYEGDWVPLADMRQALGGLTRGQQDAALQSMASKPDVHLIRWDNVRAIRQRDLDAAFEYGGDINHVIRIERS